MSTIKRRNNRIKLLSTIGHAYSININPNPFLKAISAILHWPIVPFSTKWLFQRVEIIANRESWEQAQKVGLNIHIPYRIERAIFDKKDFSETVWLPFEHIKVPVPKGFDRILCVSYGDYMKFPPVKERGLWHSFVFQPDIPYKSIK